MIPDFQSLMLPLLKLISDGKEYKMDVNSDNMEYDSANLRKIPIPTNLPIRILETIKTRKKLIKIITINIIFKVFCINDIAGTFLL